MTDIQGIRISKSGYSVTDADQKQILVSEYPLLKKYISGTGTITKAVNDSTVTVEITHNLGYIPQVFVYGNYIDENAYPTPTVVNRYKLFSFSDTPGLDIWDFYTYYADATKLYITYTTTAYITSQVALNYIYHIFYDPES